MTKRCLLLVFLMFLIPSGEVGAKGCKKMRDCKDAVVHWCSGEAIRDKDNDGIPCENVCRNKAQVDQIRREIGC